MRQPDPFQHGAGNGFRFRFRCLLHHRLRQHDVATDRLVREEIELLEDHTDLQPQGFQMQIIVEKLRAGDRYGTGRNRLQPVDAAKQGRFSRAALADDGDDLAGLHIKVDAFQNLVAAIAFADFSDFDERH